MNHDQTVQEHKFYHHHLQNITIETRPLRKNTGSSSRENTSNINVNNNVLKFKKI